MDLVIPKDHEQNGVSNADFIVYVGFENVEANWLANSGPCILDHETNRPVASVMHFNLYYLKTLNISDPFAWMSWVPTTTHEMVHGLGFMLDMFENFVDPKGYNYNEADVVIQSKVNVTGSPNGVRVSVTLKPVVELARKYFNCPSAKSVPLED